MKHPRRAAAIVTGVAGVLAVSACIVGQVAGASTPRSTAAPAPISSVVQATASPPAEFVVPLYVPAPPTGVLGPEDGSDVLTPDNVITPSPTPTAPRRAVIRPA